MRRLIGESLDRYDDGRSVQSILHGRRLGLTDGETREYLQGFNYRLGDRERKAIETFRGFVADLGPLSLIEQKPLHNLGEGTVT